MPNENKKLSASEYVKQKVGDSINVFPEFFKASEIYDFMDEFSAQQCAEKDKEIERLRLIGLDRAGRAGLSVEDIIQLFEEKLEINKDR